MRRRRRAKEKKDSKVVNAKKIAVILSPLIAVYLGIAIYFINHFQFGSTINCIDVSGKTVEEANQKISEEIAKYALTLNGRKSKTDKIVGTDIDLQYKPDGKIEEFKKKQSPLGWIISIFKSDETELNNIVEFDKVELKNKMNKLSFFKEDNIIEPKNPTFEYNGKEFEIKDEIKGTRINKDTFFSVISKAILDGKTEIDLDKENCYDNPKYTASSQETVNAKKELDKYTGVEIEYNFDDRKEVVDGNLINEWLLVDDNMNVILKKSSVRKYVESLAMKYNTFSNTRDFKASTGEKIKVIGGNYGWIINKSQETDELMEAIKSGQDSTREPVYSQKAISRKTNDVGDTYLEINLTKQHVWFYKNGALVTEGDVVTGNTSLNLATPVGTYRLNYKEKNATLKGENYSSKVSYWMPFNDNIGLHDAIWRTDFGKQIYLNNGSHGCINAPYELAEKVFDSIEAGTPVVCYQ